MGEMEESPMGMLSKEQRKQEPCHGGNQTREWLRNLMWETEEEMLNAAPENISTVDLSLIALHAMMKPRLEVIIALLLDIRDNASKPRGE